MKVLELGIPAERAWEPFRKVRPGTEVVVVVVVLVAAVAVVVGSPRSTLPRRSGAKEQREKKGEGGSSRFIQQKLTLHPT